MNAAIETMAGEMQAFLDRQAEQIDGMLGLLTEFRSALIRRDETGLRLWGLRRGPRASAWSPPG